MMDGEGNLVYDSASHFENLKTTNMGLVKAFFKKDEVEKLPSNYIGRLDIYKDGRKPTRSYNQQNGFYAAYIEQYKVKQREKLKQKQMENQAREDAFKKEMQDLANQPHEVHYKTSHAEVLTPQKREEFYQNMKR